MESNTFNTFSRRDHLQFLLTTNLWLVPSESLWILQAIDKDDIFRLSPNSQQIFNTSAENQILWQILFQDLPWLLYSTIKSYVDFKMLVQTAFNYVTSEVWWCPLGGPYSPKIRLVFPGSWFHSSYAGKYSRTFTYQLIQGPNPPPEWLLRVISGRA